MSSSKFALVGNGFIAPKHIEAIKHVGGELVAVCDIDESKKIEGIPFFTDYKEAIKEADIVCLCTPNYLHPDMIRECAIQNKKILCEKPISFDKEDFYWLKDINGLFGNFQLRYLPEVGDMRTEAETADMINLVVEMKRSRTYHQTWKGDATKTGGLLMNIGCHYFDLIGHLFGYEGFESRIYRMSDTFAEGALIYPKKTVCWRIQFIDEQPEYERSLTMNGKKFDLVQQSNLHLRTYEDFMWGHGIKPEEEEKIIKMIYAIQGL